MTGQAWRYEFWRAIIFLIFALVTTMATGHLWISLLVWLGIYLAMQVNDLSKYYAWIGQGSRVEQLPDFDGVWEDLASKIIRDRKANSSQRRHLKALLTQFNTTAEALPDATVLLDDQMRVLWLNPVASRMLSISRESDLGQRIDNLLRDPVFHNLVKSGNFDHAIEMQHPADENRVVSLRLIHFARDRYLMIAQDISERKQLQRSRRAFIANASHELKTPLTVIAGYLDAISSDPELSADLRPAIEQSKQQSLRMKTIIEDMLSLSRIEHDEHGPIRRETIEVELLVRKVVADISETIQEDSHSFELDLDPELTFDGVPNDIESLVQNLVGNAVRHTPAGTCVSVVWKRLDSGCYQLVVSDNGPGVEKKHLPHLTERFYRVQAKNGSPGGTGLGLAIVKHIVNMHDGVLDIESELGRGTTFIMTFPPEDNE